MKNTGYWLIVATFVIFNGLSVRQVAATTQTEIPGPAGSGQFGRKVNALPNGNIVITDPFYDITSPTLIQDVGAVYLYNGATGALINVITGSTANDRVGLSGVTVLPNGDYVVRTVTWNNSAGAVTHCNGTTGCTGVVSAANSLVGSTANNRIGDVEFKILANGNYVINSQFWDSGATTDVGAVTLCSGTTGCTGVVSAANSLIGSTANDSVGSGGIAALTNGNYVVVSQSWDNGGTVDVGAVTFCNGTTGCAGAVSSANSLIGSSANDIVGDFGIRVLTNGNYVVVSSRWDSDTMIDVGAITFCNGTTGCTGIVSVANSLVGSFTSNFGISILELTNGNYVVSNPTWRTSGLVYVGVVTWCSGTTGCTGVVSAANSLVGSTSNDNVGSVVKILTNGNYVVSSEFWNNGAIVDAGAVTFCDGTTGCTGMVSAANSLVGSRTEEQLSNGGVTALTNGNYVVSNPKWNFRAGAVTFCNGTTGCTGEVSAANSLVGAQTNFIDSHSVMALPNGNYVANSSGWDGNGLVNAGAVTFCNGTTGCTGAVSSANSLVGSTNGDFVGGNFGVKVLSNGNYVVNTAGWDNGAIVDAGAVTWCSGTTGCTGAVSPANSLVGSTNSDSVGGNFGVSVLSNGNYTVGSPGWDNGATADVGAVTLCNGTTGCTGIVSAVNSLVGSTAGDSISNWGVTALTNGNYVITSPNWNNSAIVDAGAVSWCSGTTGCTGAVSAVNSLIGSTAFDRVGLADISRKDNIFTNGVVALPSGNYTVRSSSAGAFTFGDGNSGTVGVISAKNSVFGFVVSEFSFDAVNNQIAVGLPGENLVRLFRFTTTPTPTPTPTPTATPTSTPTPTPTPTPVVSGRVTYANALTTTGVPSTTLNAAGSIPLSTTTDSNGDYSLRGFGSGAYTVTPSKNNQVNGISNLDASTVAQHVAGLITLNANQQIAADTSGNGAISALDAAYIAQFVASISNPGITGTWKFLPASRSYPNVLTNQTGQDYSAILVGEVTGNWNPAGTLLLNLSTWNPIRPLRFDLLTVDGEQPRQAEKAAKEVVRVTASAKKSAGEETAMTLDLTTTETTGEGILSYQFDVLYDSRLIEPQAIGCYVSETLSRAMTAICYAATPGVLKVVVFGTTPMSGTGTLLRLKFNVVGMAGKTSPLALQNFMFNEGLPTAVTVNGQR